MQLTGQKNNGRIVSPAFLLARKVSCFLCKEDLSYFICEKYVTISYYLVFLQLAKKLQLALRGRGETRALIGGGGGVNIHIFVFCPTNFF